jgi:hypothetical protein
MKRASFGLRGVSQTPHPPVRVQRTVPVSAPVNPGLLLLEDASPVDDELRAWKQQRSFTMPWKQLCLMASICFGVASFVLPENVNAAVNWLLYGLTAMSFWVWFKGRRARAKA